MPLSPTCWAVRRLRKPSSRLAVPTALRNRHNSRFTGTGRHSFGLSEHSGQHSAKGPAWGKAVPGLTVGPGAAAPKAVASRCVLVHLEEFSSYDINSWVPKTVSLPSTSARPHPSPDHGMWCDNLDYQKKENRLSFQHTHTCTCIHTRT